MKSSRAFKNWTSEEHETWRMLATRQLSNLENKISELWWRGWQQLKLTTDHIPDFDQVSERLEELVGWKLVSTPVQYSDGKDWFQALKQNEFLVTEYIRDGKNLDYTPLPDIFHDAFGHLPFLANPEISQLIRHFTKLMLQANPEQRKQLGHVWWYVIEFGLIREGGAVRALGAGLASSFAELNRVFAGKTKQTAFQPEVVLQRPESPHEFHEELFVVESLEEVEEFLTNWSQFIK